MHADILSSTGSVIHYNLKTPLSAACKDGHLHVVKYLLTSSELKEHASIKQRRYHALFEACMHGWFDIVHYFLNFPELKDHYDINTLGNEDISLFSEAASRGRVDIVRYLLESSDLEKHPDVHENDDFAFKCGLKYTTDNHKKLLKYLIFDVKIDITENIRKHLVLHPDTEVEKWIQVRDINHALENELVSAKIDRNKQIKL
jgi:ankyrin repeat protein